MHQHMDSSPFDSPWKDVAYEAMTCTLSDDSNNKVPVYFVTMQYRMLPQFHR